MKSVSALVLFLGVAIGAEPHFALRAVEPVANSMRGPYSILPTAALGLSWPKPGGFALTTELFGSYAQGTGAFSSLRVWEAGLRFGVEYEFIPNLDAYLTPWVMLVRAAERVREVDVNQRILDQWYSGTSLGVALSGGVTLFSAGNWRFGIDGGVDLVSVSTGKKLYDYYYPYYYDEYHMIPLSGFFLGFAARSRHN